MNYIKVMIVLMSFGVCSMQASAAACPASVGGKTAPKLQLPAYILEAVVNNDLRTIKAFLDKSPEYIEARRKYDDQTLLHFAVANDVKPGKLAMVEDLLLRGADVNALDYDGNTPLLLIADNRDTDNVTFTTIVQWLLDRGADINQRNNYQMTPLHYSVTRDKPKNVETLLQRKALVNAKNSEGETPFFWAIEGNNRLDQKKEIVRILLRYGANPLMTNNEGKTILDMIQLPKYVWFRKSKPGIVEYVREVMNDYAAAQKMGKVLTGEEGGKEYILPDVASIVAEYLIGPRIPAKKAPESEDIIMTPAGIAAEYIVGQQQPAKKAHEGEKKSEDKQ